MFLSHIFLIRSERCFQAKFDHIPLQFRYETGSLLPLLLRILDYIITV